MNQHIAVLPAPEPMVVATMPPRTRHVLVHSGVNPGEDDERTYAAVAFAVWSNGTITPIVEQHDRYVTIGAHRDWRTTDHE